MKPKNIGFLHPGAMGISLAVIAQNSGHQAYWVSQNRSSDTRSRAEKHDLVAVETLQDLCKRCAIIISVCPPHAAIEVAAQVVDCSFKGIFADFNAISPQKAQRIGQSMCHSGVEFIDGGIIGPPAWIPDTTWLYLSGQAASQVADCFKGGPLAVEVIGSEIGKASGLKMCFAANTKGTTALLCAIVAAAEKMGVRQELENQWSRNNSDFVEKTRDRIRNATAKAWRFSGEMEEISSTFQEAGLPGDFHLAASDIYQRIAGFKNSSETPSIDDVLEALLKTE